MNNRLFIVKTVLCFLLVACCTYRLSATTLYMSPSGSDKNPGTKRKPLASLNGARDKIRELR
ncbi:MAG: hypothetical protein LBQ01_02490, partial [Prevotellaceae bacterium]|nr:hypothetical protein [Prevotellaceae bacterium]